MASNFIHPETKKPGIEEEDGGVQQEVLQEPPVSLEGEQGQISADYEARMDAARQIVELRSNANMLPGSESSEGDTGSSQETAAKKDHADSINNLNALIGGDPEQVRNILKVSQMNVPELASHIRQNRAPHFFVGANPDRLVEALGDAADDNPDNPMAV
jgi:hypothetical protein